MRRRGSSQGPVPPSLRPGLRRHLRREVEAEERSKELFERVKGLVTEGLRMGIPPPPPSRRRRTHLPKG